MKLVKNLHAYVWRGNDNNCNRYLFASVMKDGKHVLIDPGHTVTPYYGEPGLESLITEMKQDGLDIKDAGMVILTHGHQDHCDAAKAVKELSGALIAMHRGDEPSYRHQGGKVDIYLEEGELLLGDKEPKFKLNIYHSPGHSPGHITIYWPEEKVLIAGDVIFYLSTGRVDLPGGSAALLTQSIERLAKLDIEYVLCGHPYGHPGIIKGKTAVQRNFDYIKKNILG